MVNLARWWPHSACEVGLEPGAWSPNFEERRPSSSTGRRRLWPAPSYRLCTRCMQRRRSDTVQGFFFTVLSSLSCEWHAQIENCCQVLLILYKHHVCLPLTHITTHRVSCSFSRAQKSACTARHLVCTSVRTHTHLKVNFSCTFSWWWSSHQNDNQRKKSDN